MILHLLSSLNIFYTSSLLSSSIISLFYCVVLFYCIAIINGKGSKQRVVPCGSVLSEQLKIYFDYRNSINSNISSLFLTSDFRAVSENTIKMLFARIKKKRGFNRVYPHLLRHTFATNFIYRGGNLEVLRVLMGHANINITQIYIHLAEQKKIINEDYQSNLDFLISC